MRTKLNDVFGEISHQKKDDEPLASAEMFTGEIGTALPETRVGAPPFIFRVIAIALALSSCAFLAIVNV